MFFSSKQSGKGTELVFQFKMAWQRQIACVLVQNGLAKAKSMFFSSKRPGKGKEHVFQFKTAWERQRTCFSTGLYAGGTGIQIWRY